MADDGRGGRERRREEQRSDEHERQRRNPAEGVQGNEPGERMYRLIVAVSKEMVEDNASEYRGNEEKDDARNNPPAAR